MTSKITQSWIPIEAIERAVQLEPALFILLVAITAWIVYKLFLGQLSPERHRNLRALFRNLLIHSIIGVVLFTAFWAFQELNDGSAVMNRIIPYVGLLAVFWGATIFIKSCRIIAFEYLFFFNMQVGVPLLLVNLLTLLISLMVGGWVLSSIFEFQLAPLLATSAMFSIVLGLAMQDTLGNLFAGVALQLDKPYGIGDWIEIMNGTNKIVGLVNEITWRATVLVATTDEIITIPNRVVAQSQVSNFSGKMQPILRSQAFRVPYGTSIKKVREILLEAGESVKGIRKHPEPLVLINESTDSWLLVKLIYHIDNYGSQFVIADKLISRVLELFEREKIDFASNRLTVYQEKKAA